jgi:short-subunit dehydrogenase
MDERIGNRIALVFGGSSGLGRAISQQIVLQEKQAICVVSRTPERLAETVRRMQSNSAPIFSFAADITVPGELDSLSSFLDSLGYTVDTLFNVAGVAHFGPLEDTSVDDVARVVACNLLGPIYTVRHFLPQLRATRGSIVNVISRCALRGIKNETVYSAAKWGLRGFSEALREELAGSGVRVTSVYPGGMNTDFWNGWEAHRKPEDIPSFMDPEDVASQVVAAAFAGASCTVTEVTISRRL